MSHVINDTIAWEGSLLLISILLGIVFMLSYDILRILRKLIRHGVFALAVEDGLYWILCGIGIFVMLYRENEGLLRWFVLAGIALGMLMENSWISPWFVKICTKVLKAVFGVLGKLFRIFTKPLRKLNRKWKRIFRKRLKKIGKAFKIGVTKK